MLEKYMGSDEWVDRRDRLLLASLKRRRGGPDMIARHAVPLRRLLVLRIRLKLGLWRYLARRAVLRLMRRLLCRGIRRVLDWMEPTSH